MIWQCLETPNVCPTRNKAINSLGSRTDEWLQEDGVAQRGQGWLTLNVKWAGHLSTFANKVIDMFTTMRSTRCLLLVEIIGQRY